MAAHYLREVRGVQPADPYALGGAAFGGLIALEMAQRLRAEGETVELLALFDTPGPGQMPPNKHGGLSAEAADELLAERMSAEGVEPGESADAYARQVFDVYRANLEALHAYRPTPYAGPVLYFLAAERRDGIDPARPDSAWTPLARAGLMTHTLPGDYLAMFAPANAETIARVVTTNLQMGKVHSE
ncbi:hypothetical protein GCM10010430_56270 [Kitasatospora cystarginea]|uniref:Thioesterase domain-containing protein n=2 Tax=Kitasatospora cystarginea TaxID=58350 RepID=A0ABP5RJV7_9ACTN